MKEKFLRHFQTNAVLIVLLIAAISIALYIKYASPAKPDQPKPVVYYLSDELHFAVIPDAIEQEHKTGNVVIDKVALKAAFPVSMPLGAGNFTGMGFIVPGVAGLENFNSYFYEQARPLNRDRNLVGVFVEPRSEAVYDGRVIGDERTALRREFSDDVQKKYPITEHLGMKCMHRQSNRFCVGEIRSGLWASIRLDDENLRSESYWPSMRVTYHTNAYGGLYITWDAFIEHAAKWREIDAKFWQLMHQRNVLEQP